MAGTKEGWIKRRLNGNGTSWLKGKSRKDYPLMGFQKGHKCYLKGDARKRSIENHKGENHWNWKGGVTKLIIHIRNCYEYKQWVSSVLMMDNYVCQKCNKRGGNLEAHHIKEFNTIFHEHKIKSFADAIICSELWDINNGMTLCVDCHDSTKHL